MPLGDDEIRKLARDAAGEQGMEAIERMSKLAITMYQGLSNGMPSKLAATLTRDWFYLSVHKANYPAIRKVALKR